MAGRYDTDIRLDENWHLTQARTGDAPTCSDEDCFIQDICLEAITQPGELFYDTEWGWGLQEFINSEDSDFTRLEIRERVKEKMSRRPEVDATTVTAAIRFEADSIRLHVGFSFANDDRTRLIGLNVGRVEVEVETID